MPVNPVFTIEDLDRYSIFLTDELDAISKVLEVITTSEEMQAEHGYIILWCARNVRRVSNTLTRHIKGEPKETAKQA